MGTGTGVDDDGRNIELTGDDRGRGLIGRGATETEDGAGGRTRDQARVRGRTAPGHHLGGTVHDDITGNGHAVEAEHTEGAIGRKARQLGVGEATDAGVAIGASTSDGQVLRKGSAGSVDMRATLEDDVRGTEVGRGIAAGLEAVGVSRTAAADVDLSTRAITESATEGDREGIVRRIARPAIGHEDRGDDAVGNGHVGLGARTSATAKVDIAEHAVRVTRATLADGEVRSRVIEDERTREVGEGAR